MDILGQFLSKKRKSEKKNENPALAQRKGNFYGNNLANKKKHKNLIIPNF